MEVAGASYICALSSWVGPESLSGASAISWAFGLRCRSFLHLNIKIINRMIATPATAAPTPMPAFAPVESPEFVGALLGVLSGLPGPVVCVALACAGVVRADCCTGPEELEYTCAAVEVVCVTAYSKGADLGVNWSRSLVAQTTLIYQSPAMKGVVMLALLKSFTAITVDVVTVEKQPPPSPWKEKPLQQQKRF